MALTDYKVKDADFTAKDIASLSDRPSADGMGATALKERFDAGAKKVLAPKLNALIDELLSEQGADNIGITPIEGLAGYTVQQILTAVKILLDDKQSIEQSNIDVGKKFDTAEAQALVKSINFTKGTGVFTITKYDGTEETIDTPIEKIPLDVRLDGQDFVLTLDDGTEQRVDISKFLTETEVKNSDTITLAIESGVIVARLASGSVTMAHLNPEVTAYIEAKEQSAANSAASASVSEQNALNSANSAKASEETAKACQEQACLCATQAEISRQAAATSEQAAKEAAEKAKEAAGGDFVTNTEFNNFKENVPTLSDGKLQVQSGGWYIDENTTEEDKAEAQEALKEIGGFLPLDGSVPMTGKELGLYNGHGRISADDKTINLFSRDNADLNDYRNLCLQNRTQAENINNALILNEIKNGSAFGSFRIFGEHNYKNFVLPLDGSVPMTGKLTTPQLIQDNYAVPTELGEMIDFHLNGSTADFDMRLGVDANGYPIFHDKNRKPYNIFGEHNKPSGSYTGNGSATSREITIPALSTYDLITIQSSTGYIGLVGAWGAVFIDVTSSVAKGYSASVIKRTANGITIAGTENAFNKNGVTYYYGTI